jgi:hypothetical protein
VNYEDAFQALKDDDLPRAVALLEKAARETAYSSDIINHSYTLALYRAGDKTRLAAVAFEVGKSLVAHDRGSAMDYFQRALSAGLDPERVDEIGTIFKEWAVAISSKPSVNRPINRVAHVVGSLVSGDRRTDYLKVLVTGLVKHGIKSSIFTTEPTASWFFNASGGAISSSVEIDADIHIAAVEGDFEQRAVHIAEEILASGFDIALFHGALDQQITARVASMRPARLQIGIVHDPKTDGGLFDARIYLSENAMRRTSYSTPARCIFPASDIEAKLQMIEPITRQSMGIESASSVSATFGDLHHASEREYLGVLVEVMNRFPKHFHLFAGPGNVRTIRSFLHSEGVLPRVRFLGPTTATAPLLDMLDIYLASFPVNDPKFMLDAMAAAKPCVVLRTSAESPNNASAEFVGIPALIAPTRASYIDITDRLLRNSGFRTEQQKAVKERFRAEFRPERQGERYKDFLQELCESFML